MPRMFVAYPKDTNHHPGSGDFNQILDAIQVNGGGTKGGIHTLDFDVVVTTTPNNASSGNLSLYGDNNTIYIVDSSGTKTRMMIFDDDYSVINEDSNGSYTFDARSQAETVGNVLFLHKLTRKMYGMSIELQGVIETTAVIDDASQLFIGGGYVFTENEADLTKISTIVLNTDETVRDNYSTIAFEMDATGDLNKYNAALGGVATATSVDSGHSTTLIPFTMKITVESSDSDASDYAVDITVDGTVVHSSVAPQVIVNESLIYPFVLLNGVDSFLTNLVATHTRL